MNLNIDKNLLNKFLLEEQKKLENEILIKSKLINQSCIQLKDELETSINDLIVNNKRESTIRFDVKEMINFRDCGLDKDILELNDFVKEKTGLKFRLNVFQDYSGVEYYFHPKHYETMIKVSLEPNKSFTQN